MRLLCNNFVILLSAQVIPGLRVFDSIARKVEGEILPSSAVQPRSSINILANLCTAGPRTLLYFFVVT